MSVSVLLTKRGQISLFLIVGAVLVIVAGLGWYFLRSADTAVLPDSGNLDEQQVRAFVQGCLRETAFQSLDAIGRGGGYADPASIGYYGLPNAATESSALQTFPGEPPLPYWSYLQSRNTCTNCVLASEMLPLTSDVPGEATVQGELEADIARNFGACINNFASLSGLTVTALADPVFTASFGERDVTIAAEYPLEIQGASLASNSRYQVTVDVPLQKLYRTAYDIREVAESSKYFETLASETIAYAAVSNAIPPPVDSIDVGYDPGPIWVLASVREKVADALTKSVGQVQLYQSRNMDFVRTGDSTTDRMYANSYYVVGEDVSEIDASFVYLPEWTPYVKVSPGAETIRPQMFPRVPMLPQFKRNDFQYDVSFPVLVQLKADTSRGPFMLQFPLEVNVRDNKPINFEQSDNSEDDDELAVCRPEVAVGSKLALSVTEGDFDLPVDAFVRYACVDDECSYGSTAEGMLTQQLPPCVNGELTVEREGFRTAKVKINSITSEDRQVYVSLARLRPVTVQVQANFAARLRDLPDKPWVLSGTGAVLDETYKTIVVFTPVGDDSYTQIAVIPPGEEQSATIQLAPGQYSVIATVMKSVTQPHVVAGEEYCGGGFIGIGDTCETADPITFGDVRSVTLDDGTVAETIAGEVYVGGLAFDTPERVVDLSPAQIDGGSITVPVVVVPLSELQLTSDLEVLGLFDSIGRDLVIY